MVTPAPTPPPSKIIEDSRLIAIQTQQRIDAVRATREESK